MTSIKVTEAATVFRGEETIYHYDFPAEGILEGWAIPGIKQQLAQLGGELELPIDGDHPAVEVLTDALTGGSESGYEEYEATGDRDVRGLGRSLPEFFDEEERGLPGQRSLPEPETSVDPTPTDPALTLIADRQDSGSSPETVRFRVTWFHVLLAVVVLVVIAASWWAIQRTTAKDVAPASSITAEVSASQVPQDEVTKEPEPAPPAGSVPLETDLLTLSAPQGFRAMSDNGAWVLTGQDANLRIHLIVNRVFGVPPAEMFKEISKNVESDPALSHFVGPAEATGKGSYQENPGDGSHVHWVVWFAGDNEISVGCHTRAAPSMAQKAACSMVVDSTVLKK